MTILTFVLGMITGAVMLAIAYIAWALNELKKYTKNEIKNFAEKGAEFLNVELKDDPMQNAMDAWEKRRKENNNDI